MALATVLHHGPLSVAEYRCAAGPADYGPRHHAAFLIDPDGNNVEAVCLVA